MKKAIAVLGAVLILVLIALLCIPILMDANHFRPLVQSKLEQVLRRKVSFDRLQLKTIPSFRLQIENLHIQDSRLPAGMDLMVSPSVEIHVDPLAYLRGKTEVESIRISKPVLQLNREVLSQKAPKEDAAPGTSPAGTSPAGERNEAGFPKGLNVQLDEMTVGYWDDSSSSRPAFQIQNIRARFWDPDPPEGNPFLSAQAEVNLEGATIQLSRLTPPLLIDEGLARLVQNRLLIEQVKARLDNSTFEGNIQVNSFLEPIVRFELRSPELKLENIERWRNLVQETSVAIPAGGKSLTSSPSSASDIQGTLAVERLGIGPRNAEQVVMQLRWTDNQLVIPQLQGQIFGGQLKSSGQILPGSRLPEYQLKVEIRQADLGLIFASASGKPRMEGLLDLTGNLQGAGLDFHREQSIQNLRADGRFTIQKGKINTFELSEKLKFLNTLTRIASGDEKLSSDLNVQSDYRFTGKEVKSRSMEARAGLLTLLLDGSFTTQGFLDYQVQPKMQAPSRGQDSLFGAIMGVVSGAVQSAPPFRVRGTLDNLEVIL